MSPARQGPPAAEVGIRLARAGVCIAASSLSAAAAAGRLRKLRGAGDLDQARARALVLRDVCRRLLDLHRVRAEVEGPIPLGPVLLASNHVSWLDPLVVGATVPCVPVSKLDVSGWPIIGGLVTELGVLFVNRGDPGSGAQVIRGAERALAAGVPVLNFPEGTTTTGQEVLPFRRGLFGLARRAGVPVVPVALSYDPPHLAWVGDATFLPHYLRLASDPSALVRIRLGHPVEPAGYPGPADLASAVRERILEFLGGTRDAAVGA